jgi:hypothetical protein
MMLNCVFEYKISRLFLVILFVIISMIGKTQNSLADSLVYDLETFTFLAQRVFNGDEIKLSNRDFKRLAASFDDPTRVLMHYPGFHADNDQSNEISYQGLSSGLMTWQLNGIDIVNPNHLSNAGNGSDLSSSGAGGVNMVSGNIIHQYQYQSSNSINSNNTNLAGAMNIAMDTLSDNYIQTSLLGLESGLKYKINNTQIFANYRYSFTGILGDLGVKFGNEDIRFQDLSIVFQNQFKNGKLNLVYLRGNSSNTHEPLLENALTIKDYLNINYGSKINALVSTYDLKMDNKKDFQFKAAYSSKGDHRILTGPVKFNSIQYLANDSFKLNNEKIALDAKINHQKYSYGIKAVLHRNSYSNIHKFIDLSHEYTLNEYLPYATLKVKQNQFYHEFYGAILVDQFIPVFNIKTDYNIGEIKLSYGLSRRAQSLGSQYKKMINEKSINAHLYSKSWNNQLDISIPKNKSNTSLILFYNVFEDAPLHQLDQVGNLKDYDGLNGFDYNNDLIGIAFGKGQIYGATFQWEYQNKDIWVNINSSIFKSDFASEHIPSYIVNISLGKNFKFERNELSVSTSFNAKSPKQVFSIIPERHVAMKDYLQLTRLGKYMRWDMRINYTLKKAIWSLDIQNLLSRSNQGFLIQEIDGTKIGGSLGILPVLGFRRIF